MTPTDGPFGNWRWRKDTRADWPAAPGPLVHNIAMVMSIKKDCHDHALADQMRNFDGSCAEKDADAPEGGEGRYSLCHRDDGGLLNYALRTGRRLPTRGWARVDEGVPTQFQTYCEMTNEPR